MQLVQKGKNQYVIVGFSQPIQTPFSVASVDSRKININVKRNPAFIKSINQIDEEIRQLLSAPNITPSISHDGDIVIFLPNDVDIYDYEKRNIIQNGFEFIQNSSNDFRVSAMIQPYGVWKIAGRYGISWKTTQICYRPIRMAPYCFVDDDDDDDDDAYIKEHSAIECIPDPATESSQHSTNEKDSTL